LREALFQNKFYRVKLFTIGFLRKNSGKTKKELEAAGNLANPLHRLNAK